jgi:hypothetical protein
MRPDSPTSFPLHCVARPPRLVNNKHARSRQPPPSAASMRARRLPSNEDNNPSAARKTGRSCSIHVPGKAVGKTRGKSGSTSRSEAPAARLHDKNHLPGSRQPHCHWQTPGCRAQSFKTGQLVGRSAAWPRALLRAARPGSDVARKNPSEGLTARQASVRVGQGLKM